MVTTSADSASPTPPGTVPAGSSGRRTRHPSVRGPAFVVLGIAVFILVAGVVASALASGGKPPVSLRSVTIGGGDVVPLTPATAAMRPIVSASEPPADVIGNLVVPAGSTVSHVVNNDQNQGQFDRTVYFTTRLTSDQVVGVYRAALPKLGWQVLYAGAGSGRAGTPGTEVLAKLGSGDGFYWEVGAVASPTTPDGVTPFSVELFELSDDS